MRFNDVVVLAVSHVDAPHRISTELIEQKLGATLSTLGMKSGSFAAVTGIRARRFWDHGVEPSEAATWAGELALQQAGVSANRVGALVSTSVSKDCIEPAIASIVHDRLGLRSDCMNFDIGNACLAFINGMDTISMLIERGDIQLGLVVNGESSRYAVEKTIARLTHEQIDEQILRDNFATLTLGSGAAAMVLAHRNFVDSGHYYKGGISRSASQWNYLCRGQADHMVTDSRELMSAGVALAQETWTQAQTQLHWGTQAIDHFVMHQVGQVHTQKIANSLGIPMERVPLLYPEFGNIGPASVPIVLSKSIATNRIQSGARIALMGIGSGLNCTMAELEW